MVRAGKNRKISRLRGLAMVLIVPPSGIHCCCDAQARAATGHQRQIGDVRAESASRPIAPEFARRSNNGLGVDIYL
jgi:hypothetical protein